MVSQDKVAMFMEYGVWSREYGVWSIGQSHDVNFVSQDQDFKI